MIAFERPILPQCIFGLMVVCGWVLVIPANAGQTGRSNPLAGDGVHPVLYYYDYSDDGITTDQLVHDKTNNTNDTDDPNFTRDDLVTSVVREGNPPNNPFQFLDGAGLNFLLPGSRVWDVQTTGNGGLTATQNILDHQRISDAGGYTFETYLMRTTDTAGVFPQHIWNPEGMHSIEITTLGQLQFAIRGLNSFLIPRAALNSTVMPLNTWHHIMAVMTVDQKLPNGGDPGGTDLGGGQLSQGDPLLVHYQLYIDGVSYNAGSSIDPLPGDYNGDRVVNAADYVVWRKNNGLMGGATASKGDGNGDGNVTSADYDFWRARFGATPAPINPLPPGGSANLNNMAVSPGLTLNTSPNPEHGVGWNEFGAPEGTQTHFNGQLALTRLSLGALTVEQSLFLSPPGNGSGTLGAAPGVPEPSTVGLALAGVVAALAGRAQVGWYRQRHRH